MLVGNRRDVKEGRNLSGNLAVESLQISAKSASTFSHFGCGGVEISAIGELAGSHHIRGDGSACE
jgi:hypothetical protein